MIGRGATDDKGPILGWLNVLEAHYNLGIALPVNMRFCFEAMEESGSLGLDDLIAQEAAKGTAGYFDNVDCVCIVSPRTLLRPGSSVEKTNSQIAIGSITELLCSPTVFVGSRTSTQPSPVRGQTSILVYTGALFTSQ